MGAGGNRSDILVDYPPLFRIYKDGRLERLGVIPPIPPSLDSQTRVESKDVKICHADADIFVRLFKPNIGQNSKKIPLMVYFHGGTFCTQGTFSPMYHYYLNNLASQAQILIISVEYRLAPDDPLPAAYVDCWHVLNWVASHAMIIKDGLSYLKTTTTTHCNPTKNLRKLIPNQYSILSNYFSTTSTNIEPWLLDHADFARVSLGGDSAGANIAHQMALRVSQEVLTGLPHFTGIIMFHPLFWGKTRIGDEVTKCSHLLVPELVDKMWTLVCPGSNGTDDPRMNPANDPNLLRLACEKVLIFVSGKDILRDRGVYYKEALKKSGWQGKAEVVEYKGEDHVFHLHNPSCANALDVMSKVVAFLNPGLAGIDAFTTLSRSRL